MSWADPNSPTKLPEKGKRNILITSALPYVNNVPHLGNIIGCVLSGDVYARFCRLRGHNALYICGTDEYGTTTEFKAVEEGVTPQEICDKYHALHKKIYDWFNISFDFFGRTTTEKQTEIAQDIFKKCSANGYVVEKDTFQWFCESKCQKFLADRFVEGTCPRCKEPGARGDTCDACHEAYNSEELLEPKCQICSAPPSLRSSKHLFLALDKLQPRIGEWVKQSSEKGLWTPNTQGITRSWLHKELNPRCITRDLKWGTPVPQAGFEDKVFYVWFDAPIGYVSITANYTDEWKQWWQNPEDVQLVQFMGKDNVPFHTVIFPGSLLGSGDPWTMLDSISTTEYLNYEGGKFSKSRSVGVFGDHAETTGIAPFVFRFYLLHHRPEKSDTEFVWSEFCETNDILLADKIGNFINRPLYMVDKHNAAVVPPLGPLAAADVAFLAEVHAVAAQFVAALEAMEIQSGARLILKLADACNTYVQSQTPWALKGDPARRDTILNIATNAVALLNTLYDPYMPSLTTRVCAILNVDPKSLALPSYADLDAAGFQALFFASCPAGHALNAERLAALKTTEPLIPKFQKKPNDGLREKAALEFRKQFGSSQDAASAAAPAGAAAAAAAGEGAAAGSIEALAAHFAHVELRVGLIESVEPVEGLPHLWKEQISFGDGEDARQICSGLRDVYPEAADLVGRKVLVFTNITPRDFGDAETGLHNSNGMVVCATKRKKKTKIVELVVPPADTPVGERVQLWQDAKLLPLAPADALIDMAAADNVLVGKKAAGGAVMKKLKTDAKLQACFDGIPLATSAGPCFVTNAALTKAALG